MPRHARMQSESGIYHVMLRGIDRREIFMDGEDYETFLELLERYKAECGFKLYAYCLMRNHVHLLMKVEEEGLDKILKRISVAFVYRFNLKYRRCGHLFQDRFRSEAVEDDGYFLTALRYILQNPVKAGICDSPEKYPYSSMQAYLGKKDRLTDTGYAAEICGAQELVRFLLEPNEDQCLEITESAQSGMSDGLAKELVRQTLGATPSTTKESREALAQKIRELNRKGISVRQISRISGISKGIVERCLK